MQQLATHTFQFAQAIRDFGKGLPMTVSNVEDLKALIRASGEAGATLVRAQEAPNQTEFVLRLKSTIEELRATHYWLGLIDTLDDPGLTQRRSQLMKAAEDLTDIFRSIL